MRFFMYSFGAENDPRLSEPPSPTLMAEMGAFIEEARTSGVLISTGAFENSAMAIKITLVDGEFSVTDGPFSEAKELVGGWALVELPSREEAITSAKRFLSIIGGGESRIRQVFGGVDGVR